jgi:hypothetical protein
MVMASSAASAISSSSESARPNRIAPASLGRMQATALIAASSKCLGVAGSLDESGDVRPRRVQFPIAGCLHGFVLKLITSKVVQVLPGFSVKSNSGK